MAEQERVEKGRERDEMSERIDSARQRVLDEEGPVFPEEGDADIRTIDYGGHDFLRRDGKRAGHTVRMLPFS